MFTQPNNISCNCQSEQTEKNGGAGNSGLLRTLLMGGAALAVWFVVYEQLLPFSNWFAYSLLGMGPESHLGSAVQFFVYDTPKVLMLLVLVVYGVGILRSFVTVNWTRSFLAGKRESAGNVLAALLGVVTPFCSCSAVPLFIGFMTAGIPLGVTFSFLIAAPMVNEIALVLLYGLLGWKIAALYFVTGISIAVVAGWVMGRLGLEEHVEDWVREIRAGEAASEESMTWAKRLDYALDSVKDIVGRVWKFVVLGIAVGAAIHGYVPEGQLAGIMGSEAWWSVPLSVILGIPMYTNAAGVIPVVEALLGKGAALGTVLAFMMSVIALSFPEMVILRKVLKPRLIAVFIAVVGCGILIVGYLFNAVI
ncbi:MULTISPECIES: permease [unclassified Pseudodesulfovibrio]|uniref:permease n=1 Tax=unclassified Pseudodesulfovibrio TaxID=2661612 RepID=UPI000FEBC290|nr:MULTISPECIES: permease [unclassified Pseudodesulfovibrio]MCJ2165102.1 permease [Pseudodesulfovibrio sp. S3-i]RWU03433.1 permease [Pseudodesulfovibrio sp. S3]